MIGKWLPTKQKRIQPLLNWLEILNKHDNMRNNFKPYRNLVHRSRHDNPTPRHIAIVTKYTDYYLYNWIRLIRTAALLIEKY